MKKTNKNKKESKIITVIAYGILFLVIASGISNAIKEEEQISGTAYIPVENYSYTAETYTEETYGTGSAYAEAPAETYNNYEAESSANIPQAATSWVTQESSLSAAQLMGTWTEISYNDDGTIPSFIDFYTENGQYRYERYSLTSGNVFGVNIAGETTKTLISSGICTVEESNGVVRCYYGEDSALAFALQLEGADGTLRSRDSFGDIYEKTN